MYPKLPQKRVRAPINIMEMENTMYRRKETPIQPPPSLTDEFGDLVGHVRHRVRALNVVQDPRAPAFRDELPAEDAVFG